MTNSKNPWRKFGEDNPYPNKLIEIDDHKHVGNHYYLYDYGDMYICKDNTVINELRFYIGMYWRYVDDE